MPQDKLDFYMGLYASHLSNTLSSDEKIYSWTTKQTYIAMGNMMTAAAIKGMILVQLKDLKKIMLKKF